MYKVIKNFFDLQDANYRYQVGDKFPREGAKVSNGRIKELSTTNNRRREAVIEEIKEKPVTNEEPVEKEEKPAPAKKSTNGRKKADAK